MKNTDKIIDFLSASLSPFHVVKIVKDELLQDGYVELKEEE